MSGESPRQILARLEQRARRRFGQHFLSDPSYCQRMVRGARVGPGDRVVEIGPGLGILTAELVAAGAELTAVELDRDLCRWIRESRPEVRLVEGDAARVDWAELCPDSGWKVVANLPYNVGTHIVMALVRRPETFTSITVMLQKEVVQRLMAEPRTKAYGALSVELQARARPVFLLQLAPGAFFPPPKVFSAVVRLDLFDAPRLDGVDPVWFDRVVRASFSQRRKVLRNSLGALVGREQALQGISSAGLPEGCRAEEVDVAGFVRLAAALAPG